MRTVGIRALKQNASAVVAEAAAGEVIVITDRGRPVARLTPIGGDPIDELVAAGLATRPTASLRDLPDPPPPSTPGPSLSRIVDEMREDRI